MRVVLDTNVIISALVFGGKPRLVLEQALRGDYQLVLSDPILEEIQGVLAGRKFRYPAHVVIEIAQQLTAVAEIVFPHEKLSVVKTDPDDNRILECAIAGKATVIVSGDSDLLNLGVYEKVRIMTIEQFLAVREG